MLIIKGDTVLDVTPKAYEVIYKEHDFTIQTDEEQEKQDESINTDEEQEKQAEPIKQKAPAKKAKAKAGDE